MDEKQIEFAIFCVESIAKDLDMDPIDIYDLLTRKSDILYNYILPSLSGQLVHINRGSLGWITSVCLSRIKKVPATKAGTVSMAGGGVSVTYIFGRRARNAASSSSVGI